SWGTLGAGILAGRSLLPVDSPMSRCFCWTCIAVLASACAVASAQDNAEQPATPPPRLKSSPTLEPPPLRPPQQIGRASTDRDGIFLRADRLEGASQSLIEASGRVELRTRRQTVLADWLQYDVQNDEMWAKGNVTIRQGIDWITGPEAKFKRDTEIGF